MFLPAVSVSVRLVYVLCGLAGDEGMSVYVRHYAAAFVVMAFAALRGIDAQRSTFSAEHGSFFSAIAWNSKKKRPMPWACLSCVFGVNILHQLVAGWRGRDYIFPVLDGKHGCSLSDATGFGKSMASACVVLRHFQFLMALAGVPESVAKLIRRHSFRHFPANVSRVAEFSDAKKRQVGRWADLEYMPSRYAQEVEFVAMVAIRVLA